MTLNPSEQHAGPEKPVVLVTGGTGFLGRRIAHNLLTQCCSVLLHSRSARRSADAAAELTAANASARVNLQPVSFDLTEASLLSFCDSIERLDAVVHCAAFRPHPTKFRLITEKVFMKAMRDNALATFLLIRSLSKKLQPSKYNNIVVMGSATARASLPYYSGAHYAASKAAVESLVIQLGNEIFDETRTAINCISSERVCRDNTGTDCVEISKIVNLATSLALQTNERKSAEIHTLRAEDAARTH